MDLVYAFLTASIADLTSCYADLKSCFGQDYNNIFIALVLPILSGFSRIAWNIWCAPGVIWCLLLILAFRYVAMNLNLGSWFFIIIWLMFIPSQKPWDFDSDGLKERNHFILEDFYHLWAIFLAEVACFSLTQAPKKLRKVAIFLNGYIESSLEFELPFPDVWVECHLPAGLNSRADAEMKRLLEEEVEARNQRQPLEPEFGPGTLTMVPRKDCGISQYFIIPKMHGSGSKTKRLRFRFRPQHASTQTEDITCPHCLDTKRNIAVSVDTLRNSGNSVVLDLPFTFEAMAAQTKDTHVAIEVTAEEVEEIPTDSAPTETHIKDEKVLKETTPSQELKAAPEITDKVQISSELAQNSDREIFAGKTSTRQRLQQHTEEEVSWDSQPNPCQVTHQTVQLDHQQELLEKDDGPEEILDTRKTTNETRDRTPEDTEIPEKAEDSRENGMRDITYMNPQNEPTEFVNPRIFPLLSESSRFDFTFQAENKVALMDIDHNSVQLFGAEQRVESDSETTDSMSMDFDLYGDDNEIETEHRTLGPEELNARLLAFLGQEESEQESLYSTGNTDRATALESDENIVPPDVEMGDAPGSPRDVDMGLDSESDTTEMDIADVHQNDNVEGSQIVHSINWSFQTPSQEIAEMEMPDAFKDHHPSPQSTNSAPDQELDELDKELLDGFKKVEEEESHEQGPQALEVSNEPQTLPGDLSHLSEPVWKRPTASEPEINTDGPNISHNTPSESDQAAGESEDQATEKSVINTEEEIASRVKLAPKSRRARFVTSQPEIQTHEQGISADNVSTSVETPPQLGLQTAERSQQTTSTPEISEGESQHSWKEANILRESSDSTNQSDPDGSHEAADDDEGQAQEIPSSGDEGCSKRGLGNFGKDKDEAQQTEIPRNIPPILVGGLLLPGGNPWVSTPSGPTPQLSAPIAEPADAQALGVDEEDPGMNAPETREVGQRGRIEQDAKMPGTSECDAAQSIALAVPLSAESSQVSPEQTPGPKPISDLQKRELDRLERKYRKSSGDSPRLFHTARQSRMQYPTTSRGSSRIKTKESLPDTEADLSSFFSRTTTPVVKIASPAALIRHHKEVREEERDE